MIASAGHPNKDGRATDSCSALVDVHQCGVVMEGWDDYQPLCLSQVTTCGFTKSR